MKVAVWHDLPSGGGRRALQGHIDGLVERGHDVRVWSTFQEAGELVVRRGGVEQIVVPLTRPRATWTLRGRQLLLREQPLEFVAMRRHTEEVARQMRLWRPTVLFVNSSVRVGVAPLAHLLPEVPSVGYLQEPFRAHYECNGDQKPTWVADRAQPTDGVVVAARRALRDLREGQRIRALVREELSAARDLEVILVNSIFSAETVRRVYGLDSRVCYLGVDPTVFLPGRSKREDFVVSVGQLAGHKRPLLVLEALARIQKPPGLVWICNEVDVDLASTMERRARDLGVSLTICAKVSDRELVRLLGRAFAHVYAPRLEPFGLTPIEAALCQTPTVGVREAGVRETVVDEETGVLVEPTPWDIAQGISRLRDNAAFARQLGDRAREMALTRWSLSSAQDRLSEELSAAARRSHS